MSRRRPAPAATTVSLFPFLAVLMCTMGALLVLLVIFSRAAEEGDQAAEAAAIAARAAELEQARDEFAWRLDQLGAIRDSTAADLARARLQLAGVEDDSRGLIDEFQRLDETLAALEREATPRADAGELADLEARLAAARSLLEATRREGASRPPAYAVVPYEGRNGTRRRPLYIECCIDGVFLQPEGIRLGPGDFEGPPGPGNPLASALRAAREQIALAGGSGPDDQPYPLLLVRPSGVMAYYAAREAIQSWGNDFGYQFIDEDWQLVFPPADPALAAAERRAVEEARRRLEWLAQVRPPQPTRPTQQYRAATTRGGVVAEGGPSVLGDRSRFDWKEPPPAGPVQAGASAGDPATASALGSGGGGSGGLASGAGGASGGGTAGFGTGGATDRSAAGGSGASPASLVADGTMARGGAGDRYAGPSRFYSGAGASSGSDGPGGPGGGEPAGPGADQQGLAGSGLAGTGQAGTGDRGPGGAAGPSTGSGSASAGGESGTGSFGPSAGAAGGGGASGGAAGAANASGGGGGGPSLPGLAGVGSQPQAGGASGGSASISLAGRRGANWASLATQDRPVPLTRPIKLECASDEFRLLGDNGRVEERIAIGTHTIDAVDPLVQAVHAKVGRWGLAGERMYWRPQLVLSATPDGGQRRDELEKLLSDSGLDTRRSEAAEPVRPLPPVRRPRGFFSARSP